MNDLIVELIKRFKDHSHFVFVANNNLAKLSQHFLKSEFYLNEGYELVHETPQGTVAVTENEAVLLYVDMMAGILKPVNLSKLSQVMAPSLKELIDKLHYTFFNFEPQIRDLGFKYNVDSLKGVYYYDEKGNLRRSFYDTSLRLFHINEIVPNEVETQLNTFQQENVLKVKGVTSTQLTHFLYNVLAPLKYFKLVQLAKTSEEFPETFFTSLFKVEDGFIYQKLHGVLFFNKVKLNAIQLLFKSLRTSLMIEKVGEPAYPILNYNQQYFKVTAWDTQSSVDVFKPFNDKPYEQISFKMVRWNGNPTNCLDALMGNVFSSKEEALANVFKVRENIFEKFKSLEVDN